MTKKNIKSCKIIEVRRDYIVVDFSGFGLIIETSKNSNYQINTLVDVEYTGTIGEINFKYKLFTKPKKNNSTTKTPLIKTAVVSDEANTEDE